MHPTATRKAPAQNHVQSRSNYYHGTASTFSRFKPAEWREDKWVFLTDSFKAAQYYSVHAMCSKNNTWGSREKRALGHVYSVIVPKTLLIAKLNRTPELIHLILLERMGYSGATYPDGTVNKHGDWSEELLGEMPSTSNETVIFDFQALRVEGKVEAA